MSDPQHLDILDQGQKAWNAWRRAEPDIQPDLSTEDLHGLDLAGFDLGRADLTNADVGETDFSGARLDGALLYNVDGAGACFDGASLREAELKRGLFEGASFKRAVLDGSDDLQVLLAGADLTDASFAKANLEDAILDGATTLRTRFTGAHLQGAKLMGCELASCDFRGAFLQETRFDSARFVKADLSGLVLNGAVFHEANLEGANLSGTGCELADFSRAVLRGADLRGAALLSASLRQADLRDALLDGADLSFASLVKAQVEGASFDGTIVYGISAWDLQGKPRQQRNLIITPEDQADITVDDLEVAQMLYLMYSNVKIRHFMNACTERNVLILGRFTPPERKAVLDGLRQRLRELQFVPIVFDFDKPLDRDFTETVQTLVGLSMFVIVDLTMPKSTPLELEATVKDFKIPYVPIIDATADDKPFAMFADLANSFHWVLTPLQYRGREQLLEHLEPFVVQPARQKHGELRQQKARTSIAMVSIDDLLAAQRAAGPGR